jgi:regulator of protease activity HflC (stomatin/prohibitin superfamily)
VPEGFSAIVSKFGAQVEGDLEDKTWSPGFHWFSPLNNVDKLVSKQLIVFDTPVKDVRTSDSITVSIDVMITFEITEAPNFVYGLGPEKFDDFLRASQAEVLRQMAVERPVASIYDLSGANTEKEVAGLNDKFAKWGVKIHHFTVKNVTIPDKLAKDAEERTLFDSKTTKNRMKQESDRLQLNIVEGKQKLREECDNARMAAADEAKVKETQAQKETKEVIAQTQKDIAELEVSWEIQKSQVLADADLDISKLKSQILTIEREVKSKTSAEVGKLEAEAQAYAKRTQAEARVLVAQKLAEGKKAIGAAEGEASTAFQALREHEANMMRLDVLEKLVRNERIKIATSQENTIGLSEENQVVTQVAQQGLEALRAKLAEITATSLAKIEQSAPGQQAMRASTTLPAPEAAASAALPAPKAAAK